MAVKIDCSKATSKNSQGFCFKTCIHENGIDTIHQLITVLFCTPGDVITAKSGTALAGGPIVEQVPEINEEVQSVCSCTCYGQRSGLWSSRGASGSHRERSSSKRSTRRKYEHKGNGGYPLHRILRSASGSSIPDPDAIYAHPQAASGARSPAGGAPPGPGPASDANRVKYITAPDVDFDDEKSKRASI